MVRLVMSALLNGNEKGTRAMDMTCRCKGLYTCVACKVKAGVYRDWMTQEPPPIEACSVGVCERKAETRGLCWKHYSAYLSRARKSA